MTRTHLNKPMFSFQKTTGKKKRWFSFFCVLLHLGLAIGSTSTPFFESPPVFWAQQLRCFGTPWTAAVYDAYPAAKWTKWTWRRPFEKGKSSTKHQSILVRSHVKFWRCNKTWHGTWLWLIITHTHGCQEYSTGEKKREHRRKKGVWIATSLGSRLNNQINYTFTFNLHLYIIKKLQWLKWWHLPLKASSRYFGSEHSENFTGKTPATNLCRSKFKDFSVSAGDAAGESPFATTLPGFFRWEGGGEKWVFLAFEQTLTWPLLVITFSVSRSAPSGAIVPSGFQTAKAEDSGCLVLSDNRLQQTCLCEKLKRPPWRVFPRDV